MSSLQSQASWNIFSLTYSLSPIPFMQVVLFMGRKVPQVFLALRGILETLGTITQRPRGQMGTQEAKDYLGTGGHLDHLKTEVGARFSVDYLKAFFRTISAFCRIVKECLLFILFNQKCASQVGI